MPRLQYMHKWSLPEAKAAWREENSDLLMGTSTAGRFIFYEVFVTIVTERKTSMARWWVRRKFAWMLRNPDTCLKLQPRANS